MYSQNVRRNILEDEMKRYKAINFEYDDAYGTGTALDIVEHDEGEFVKYDDIKHLLQNTSSNRYCVKCLQKFCDLLDGDDLFDWYGDISGFIEKYKKHFE